MEVKFIDFQSARFASLATDLVLFLFTSVRVSHMNEPLFSCFPTFPYITLNTFYLFCIITFGLILLTIGDHLQTTARPVDFK